jgi:energy-coupling factor transporter ATP-binding protein EcfA2
MAAKPSKQSRPRAEISKRRARGANDHFTLAVFGVVNSGKTSLARALLMKPDFGQVSYVPGSTKTVDQTFRVLPRSKSRFTIIDTPGVEDFCRIVSDFKQTADGVEERNWLEKFDEWLAAKVASLGPADPARPTVEHRFEDAYKAMRSANALCLVHKGSDLLQENVREDVAALMDVVRRTKKPVVCVLKDACGRAFAQHGNEWRDFSLSLGVNQIVSFDSHRRRRTHVRHLFQALESVLPVSPRRERMLLKKFAKALQPYPISRWNAQLERVMERTWQGVDAFNPFASRDKNTYAKKVTQSISRHVASCLEKSLVPENARQEITSVAKDVAVDAERDVEVVENSVFGPMFGAPAFYVRMKPSSAAKLVAITAFLQIESAVWGGGQGDEPSAWDELEFRDRMHQFVEAHAGEWSKRLSAVRRDEESAAFDAAPYQELAGDVVNVVESLS